VVRGGDGMAGFAVRNPAGEVVKPYQWQATADYTDQVSPGGYYSVCIDNQFSRFASKLVNIYITVVKYDAWQRSGGEDVLRDVDHFGWGCSCGMSASADCTAFLSDPLQAVEVNQHSMRICVGINYRKKSRKTKTQDYAHR